jgi:hypothetical protein
MKLQRGHYRGVLHGVDVAEECRCAWKTIRCPQYGLLNGFVDTNGGALFTLMWSMLLGVTEACR